MYIPYVPCSYRLNIHNPCYPGMSNTYKHTQRLCLDNTRVTCLSKIVWFLQHLTTRNWYIEGIIQTRKPTCIYQMFRAFIGSRNVYRQIWKRAWSGVWPSDRLDALCWARVRPTTVTIQTPEWGESQQQSWASKWGIPAVVAGSRLLPSESFAPSAELWTWQGPE